MVQKTYHITDYAEDKLINILEEVAAMPAYRNASQVLLTVLEQNWDQENILSKAALVKRILPKTEIAGITHYDHLIQDGVVENNSVITFLFFEHASFAIHRFDMSQNSDQAVGQQVNRMLREQTDVKCMMTLFSKNDRDVGLILKTAQSGLPNIPMFGADACKSTLFQTHGVGYVFDGETCYRDTLLAIVFCGADLHVKASYNCGWIQVGKTMTVTAIQDDYTISEIDHRPAAEIYERYLGIPYKRNTLYIDNICEFPLTIEQNGMLMARIPNSWTEDGKLRFQITVHRGDRIRLSYGLPQQIFSQIFSDAEEFGEFEPQGMLMVVCMNRMIFLREQEHFETDAYRKIVPGAAFLHGNSEIYHNNGAGGEMHSALIAVGFREGAARHGLDQDGSEWNGSIRDSSTREDSIQENSQEETQENSQEETQENSMEKVSRESSQEGRVQSGGSVSEEEEECPVKESASGEKLISLELRLMTFMRAVTSDLEHTTEELLHLQHNLENEVEKKTRENESLSLHVVQTLAEAIDAKDTYTNGHSGRVAAYSREIARRAGYTEKEQDDIYMMGLLHDVGKIGVPDAVINKPAKLTDEEFAMIKNHPVMGARILGNIKEMPKLVTGARWHHERYDGHGYPDGLCGTDIPEEARIIGVADAYDAMTSNRSYRCSMDQSMVREQIEKGKGTQFDPRFADIMLRMIDEDVEYRMREALK